MLVVNICSKHLTRAPTQDGVETLVVIETGPTGLRLDLQVGGTTTLVASADPSGHAPRMAALCAQLSQIPHEVRLLPGSEAPEGRWGDRWSVGFYISKAAFAQHERLRERLSKAALANCAATPAPGSDVPPPPPHALATSLAGFGLPARAAAKRALQEGGWLAKRYEAGAPWPNLALQLGIELIPKGHSAAPAAIYKKRANRTACPRKVHGTRGASARPRRSAHQP